MRISTLPVPDEANDLVSIARAYESLGYEVQKTPSQHEMPDFLREISPDLIARKAGENLIVHLKNRTFVRPLSYWLKVEALTKEHPDWKAQYIDPGSMDEDLAGGVELSNPSAIRERLDEARNSIGSDRYYALVIAFGALEAILRSITRKKRLAWDHTSTLSLIAKLLEAGYLDLDEANFLRTMGTHRNAIVHGFSAEPPKGDDIEKLIGIAEESIKLI